MNKPVVTTAERRTPDAAREPRGTRERILFWIPVALLAVMVIELGVLDLTALRRPVLLYALVPLVCLLAAAVIPGLLWTLLALAALAVGHDLWTSSGQMTFSTFPVWLLLAAWGLTALVERIKGR